MVFLDSISRIRLQRRVEHLHALGPRARRNTTMSSSGTAAEQRHDLAQPASRRSGATRPSCWRPSSRAVTSLPIPPAFPLPPDWERGRHDEH
jgi:hypothetical protein